MQVHRKEVLLRGLEGARQRQSGAEEAKAAPAAATAMPRGS